MMTKGGNGSYMLSMQQESSEFCVMPLIALFAITSKTVYDILGKNSISVPQKSHYSPWKWGAEGRLHMALIKRRVRLLQVAQLQRVGGGQGIL